METMTIRTPVITSNRNSLWQIVTTTSLTVDPLPEKATADILDKPASGQIHREVLHQQAITGAHKFSKRRSAGQVQGKYHQVKARPRLDKPVVASRTTAWPHHKEAYHAGRRNASTH